MELNMIETFPLIMRLIIYQHVSLRTKKKFPEHISLYIYLITHHHIAFHIQLIMNQDISLHIQLNKH
jgi:hypothetical protein